MKDLNIKTALCLFIVFISTEAVSHSKRLHAKEMFVKNPWHGVQLGQKSPALLNAIIEIPKGANVKYQVDKDSGLLRLDRVLYSPVFFPINYGFLPQTLGQDNDPLDIMVISSVDISSLTIVEVRPIGVMKMIDTGEVDDKILAVVNRDMSVNTIFDLKDVPIHLLNQITRFFEDYKKLENKLVTVTGFANKDTAYEIIKQAIDAYKYTYDLDLKQK